MLNTMCKHFSVTNEMRNDILHTVQSVVIIWRYKYSELTRQRPLGKIRWPAHLTLEKSPEYCFITKVFSIRHLFGASYGYNLFDILQYLSNKNTPCLFTFKYWAFIFDVCGKHVYSRHFRSYIRTGVFIYIFLVFI